MICLYLYQYLLLWDTSYIVVNRLMSTFQHKFNYVNPFCLSWDIGRQSFYSCWWPDISVICCCFCISYICADSPHLGLSSTTWFRKIGPLVVEIQAEWSLWHLNDHVYTIKSTCVVHIVWCYPSRTFYLLLCILWLVTMSSDVTYCATA